MSVSLSMAEDSSSQAKRKRSEQSSIADTQLHQIKSTTLRTTARNFFGTANQSNNCLSPSLEVSPHAGGGGKTRYQLMQSLDPIILSFNAADYETLAKSLRSLCTQDVSLSCKLVPDPLTEDTMIIADIDDYIFPEPAIPDVQDSFPHNLNGVSALLLLWVLLHETHPDAVMQIIDKRICYRQVPEKRAVTPRSTHLHSAAALLPVTTIEAVIKFSGSCITTHSLDALFSDLSQHSGMLAPPPTTLSAAADASTSSHTPSPRNFQFDGTKSQAGASGSPVACVSSDTGDIAPPAALGNSSHRQQHLNHNALAEYISNYLTQQKSRGNPVRGLERHDTELDIAELSVVTPTVTRPGAQREQDGEEETVAPQVDPEGSSLCSLQETSRKYFADVKLVFNEQDLMSRFEFNIRAAEDF